MIRMHTTGVITPDGVGTRAFALGTLSFGAFQNACVHTAG